MGEPEALCEAVVEAVGVAVRLIDLNQHTGQHPRMGAVDVIPFIPIKNTSMEEAIELSKKVAAKVADLYNPVSYTHLAGSNIKSEASGNIRMDVILSADKKFAAVQLFQFIPYTYQPITSVQYFTDEQASAVIAFLAKSKMQ